MGELESWIASELEQKNKWIVEALEILHDKKCPDKLRDFVQGIIQYLDPESLILKTGK